MLYIGSKLVAVKQNTTLSYIIQDHLGSTVGSVNTSGTTVSTISYAAFGGMRNATGTSPTDMKFTGQRLDNTGLYYYNARYYDPGIGRFISADTIVPSPSNPQSLNRYSYCLNNPLKYIDPTGHYTWWGEFCGVVNGTGNGEEGSGRGTDGNSAGPRLEDYTWYYGQSLLNGFISGAKATLGECYSNFVKNFSTGSTAEELFSEGEFEKWAVTHPDEFFEALNSYYSGQFSTPYGKGEISFDLLQAGLAVISSGKGPTKGVKINGFTKHGINSAINHDGKGVTEKAMLDAIRNPLEVVPQSGNKSKFIGKNAVVVLNEKLQVVSTWAKNHFAWRIK